MLEPIKRVLVPLDGSRRAEGAIRYAKRIASATDGTVILLRVVEIPTQQADAQGYLERVSAEYKLTETGSVPFLIIDAVRLGRHQVVHCGAEGCRTSTE